VGWVSALRDHILADHRRFSTEPLHIFFDRTEIQTMQDWRHRILGALRSSSILLVCLSPNYFSSPYCRWEWEEYLLHQVHLQIGGDSIASIYFVEVPATDEQASARWRASVTRGNFTDIRPWFPEGPAALRRVDVLCRMAKLGESIWERIDRARRATNIPGNLRRQTPFFVGRTKELRLLHERLAQGAVGLVTALNGLGGQGKTELAVAYAHGWAHCYSAGLWVVGAENKKELLPLIGELAYTPELGYRPTDAERNDPTLLGRAVLVELQKRTRAIRENAPERGAAALLLLDNVSEPALLTQSQLAVLPAQADWLRIVVTTRLDVAQFDPSGKSLAYVPVDSLCEDDALALVRDHLEPRDLHGRLFRTVPDANRVDFTQHFTSTAEEAATREIVHELGCFTLAVEQVAVFLGLHPEIAPSAYLAGLRKKGLTSVDLLGSNPDVQAQMLHRQKQLAVILEAALGLLDEPVRTALEFAAQLPPDSVPWPWLRTLVTGLHPKLAQFAPDEPDPWLVARRQLEGLRLLTPGDHPEIARIHRLVAAHLRSTTKDDAILRLLSQHLAARAIAVFVMDSPPADWELDTLLIALPTMLKSGEVNHELALSAVVLEGKVHSYRTLGTSMTLVQTAHQILQKHAQTDPSNIVWQRDLALSLGRFSNLIAGQGKNRSTLCCDEQALAICERLVSSSPTDPYLQHGLTATLTSVGERYVGEGHFREAKHYHEKAFAIAERCAQADPSNVGWQYRLAICLNRLGDVSSKQSKLKEAKRFFERAFTILERLAQVDPANNAIHQALSFALGELGTVSATQGKFPEAARFFKQALTVAQNFGESDPTNLDWQFVLACAFNRLGLLAAARGKFPEATHYFEKTLAIARRLSQVDPENVIWQQLLFAIYMNLADGEKSERDATSDALDWWFKASDQLATMKQRGIMGPEDQRALDKLRDKLGL
jgi:tetratricopeptide (TPR) repeat protein